MCSAVTTTPDIGSFGWCVWVNLISVVPVFISQDATIVPEASKMHGYLKNTKDSIQFNKSVVSWIASIF